MGAAGPSGAGAPPALWSDAARHQQTEARAEAFGYVCNRCSHCCYDKLIQVNPYEVARLARHQGVSTGAFAAKWTKDGAGLLLAHKADGACVFLGPGGCEVHADRPLVCRVYPLGRHVEPDGTERWSHLAPHPETAGVYSKSGTIAQYIAAQGALPFMQAADEYAIWLRRAATLLEDEAAAADAPSEVDDVDLLDIDSVIAAYAAESGDAAPMDIEARKALHLEILGKNLEDFEGRRVMPDKTGEARRRQLMTAVSLLSVSLGMSSAAVADQVKSEAVTQKVAPGSQVSHKIEAQNSHKVQNAQKIQNSYKEHGAPATQNSMKN